LIVTTIIRLSWIRKVPSCWLELPFSSPPPWIQKYTGSRSPASTPAGRCTFRNRQSSVSERGPFVLAAAGHRLPKATVWRTPRHGLAGAGGRQRRSPTGGRA
jgi:hypothetical protein